MTAIEIVLDTDTSLSELGSKENVYQMLKRNDLKVGSFVKMLEAMGFQCMESDSETIVDYD